MKKKYEKYVQAYWPIALFAFFALVVLSLSHIPTAEVAKLFGLVVVTCGAVAWLVNDYVKESDNRVQAKLEEIGDLLKPYDGLKLSEMPQEVQDEVRKRLGWSTPPQKQGKTGS
jgi:hypothetical protein